MALITYDDKDKSLPSTNPKRVWSDQDANLVKAVVNENAARMLNIRDDYNLASENTYPTTGGSGDIGVIKRFDAFPIPAGQGGEVPSKLGGVEFVGEGSFLIAVTDTPGADPFKWRIL